jgi:hypothetical protein
MRLPDQPSFELPVQSPLEPAGHAGAYGPYADISAYGPYGVYGPAKGKDQVKQSAQIYRQTAPQAETRKA